MECREGEGFYFWRGPPFVRAGLLALILFCPACLYGCAAATAPLWDGACNFVPRGAMCGQLVGMTNNKPSTFLTRWSSGHSFTQLYELAPGTTATVATPAKPPTQHSTATWHHAAAALIRHTAPESSSGADMTPRRPLMLIARMQLALCSPQLRRFPRGSSCLAWAYPAARAVK